jgi:hypothetical protein
MFENGSGLSCSDCLSPSRRVHLLRTALLLTPGVLVEPAENSFVVRPHAPHPHCAFVLEHLINDATLNVDSARIGASQDRRQAFRWAAGFEMGRYLRLQEDAKLAVTGVTIRFLFMTISVR